MREDAVGVSVEVVAGSESPRGPGYSRTRVSVWVLLRHPTTARRLGMAPDQPQASSSIVARSWGTSRWR